MINKTHRLTRGEIDSIKISPKKTKMLGLLSLYKNNQNQGLKVAVVVTKKISPLAVARNKYKREMVAEISKLLPTYSQTPLSIMFYPSKEFLKLSPAKKQETMAKIIESC